jgi:hypothetical protein
MHILIAALCLAAGFGLGRIKNAATLKAITAEIDKVEASVGSEAKSVIAAIRKHL